MTDWDENLKKINVIYAPNGSGKTSLAVIFQSLSGNNDLILKKKSFDAIEPVEIKFIRNGKELKYEKNGWNSFLPCIEVFNSFYIDENIYSITIEDKLNKLNIFELSNAEEMKELKKRLKKEIDVKQDLSTKIKNLRKLLKKNSSEKKEKREQLLDQSEIEREQHEKAIKELEKKRYEITEKNRRKYIGFVNKYLAMFCDNMRIINIKTAPGGQKQNIIYSLQIDNHEITLKERGEISLKYCLSDGDKNALSLSFFLARFDMIPNVNDYIMIVDDPFTSFDYQRKTTTITQLTRLASKVKQFILLTHDLHFANDFNNSCNDQILNLKITPCIKEGISSNVLCLHDIKFEMLNGFNKDIMTLRRFKTLPREDSFYLREVIRCIRPSIEGIFRIKYYSYVEDKEWLGDFINKIRTCNEASPFYRLKEYLNEIEEINDYCKQYHHSNPNYMEVGISSCELKNYVNRTLKLIELI